MRKKSSIKRQVVMMIMTISTLLIFGMAILMTSLFVRTLRRVHKETALSEIGFAAEYCVTPLLFDSPDDAQLVLDNYHSKKSVQSAVLFDGEGKRFAQMGDSLLTRPFTSLETPSAFYEAGYLYLAVEVHSEGERIGVLHVVEETGILYDSIGSLVLFMVLVFPIIMGLSYFFAQLAQKKVSTPIVELTQIIGTVDYMKKVPTIENSEGTSYEITALYKQFQNMLYRVETSERMLLNASEFLQSIIDSIQSLLIVVDSERNITMCNKVAGEYSLLDNSIGAPMQKCFPFLASHQRKISETLKSNTLCELPQVKVDQQGLETCTITLFPLQTKEKSGIVISVADVTKSVERDQQLNQIQKMETVGTLAGGLAHDFNNIINGIVGTISLMQLDDEPPTMDEYRENIALMNHSAERAKEMVDQLLTLSHKSEISFDNVDLASVVDNVVSICNHSIDKSVKIHHSDLHEKEYLTRGNSSQLEQVLLNLCINAAHSMTIMRNDEGTYGGELEISIRPHTFKKEFLNAVTSIPAGDYIELSVKDSGIGIAPNALKKVFDPFYTTKGKGEGTGLGLSMVYNIISQHQGYLNIVSAVGVGTTISIYLPPVAKDIDIGATETDHSAFPSYDGRKVLLIDDDLQIRFVATKMLKKMGFEVLYASSGEEGIDLYMKKRFQIDLVILDMVMPGISGKEAYLKLLNINPDVEVILSSGFGQDKRVLDIMALGLSGFLHKPYTFEELKEVVYKALPLM